MRPGHGVRTAAVLCTSILGFACLAGTGSPLLAAPRVPQIAVAGTALQSRLDSIGESIDVGTDQVDLQIWPPRAFNRCSMIPVTLTIQVELAGNEDHNRYGVYLPNAGVSALYEVFPAEARDGWFAVLLFRSAPTRLLVHLFDETAALRGSTTYPGVPRDSVAFYAQTASGTLYGEDARNPNGDAQALVYAGTGSNSGNWWLCWEDQPLQSSNHDFNDCILFFETPSECGTPVRRSTWGQVKERFR